MSTEEKDPALEMALARILKLDEELEEKNQLWCAEVEHANKWWLEAKKLEAKVRQLEGEMSEFREALRLEARRYRDERDDLQRQVAELERQRDHHKANALRQQENARSLGVDISELVGFDPTYEDGDGLRAAVAALVEERDDLRQRLTSTQKNALALGASVSAIVAERDGFRATHDKQHKLIMEQDERMGAMAEALADERAKVAKWLRTTEDFDYVSDGDLMMALSEAIERGEHE